MQTQTKPKRDALRPRKLGARIKHYWLAQRMAKRTGTDLCAAYESGELTQDDWKGFVERCRGCDWAEGCVRFLNKADTKTRPIPERCENRAILSQLSSKKQSA